MLFIKWILFLFCSCLLGSLWWEGGGKRQDLGMPGSHEDLVTPLNTSPHSPQPQRWSGFHRIVVKKFWVDEWMTEWVNAWVNEWMNEQMHLLLLAFCSLSGPWWNLAVEFSKAGALDQQWENMVLHILAFKAFSSSHRKWFWGAGMFASGPSLGVGLVFKHPIWRDSRKL